MKNYLLRGGLCFAFLFLAMLGMAAKPEKDLYEGITKGNIDLVRKAIADGADVNKKISMKWPLQWALDTSHRIDIIKLLIDSGADVNAGDIKGSILRQYGGNVETPAKKAEWIVNFYKKYNVDTIVTADSYSTITEVVNLLLDAGADPDHGMNTIIGSPIQACIAFGIGSEEARAEFIRAMITHKTHPANANDRMVTSESASQNSGGFSAADKEKHPTPLMYAIQKDYTQIALALIEGGADLNITMNVYKSQITMWAEYKTKSTITALDIARAKGNKTVESKILSVSN